MEVAKAELMNAYGNQSWIRVVTVTPSFDSSQHLMEKISLGQRCSLMPSKETVDGISRTHSPLSDRKTLWVN
jgi:hypothetical protein